MSRYLLVFGVKIRTWVVWSTIGLALALAILGVMATRPKSSVSPSQMPTIVAEHGLAIPMDDAPQAEPMAEVSPPTEVEVVPKPAPGQDPPQPTTKLATTAEALDAAQAEPLIDAPPPLEVPLEPKPAHTTKACAKVRTQAQSARNASQWRVLLKLAKKRRCWARRLEARKLRVQALLETRDYLGCTKAARGIQDIQVRYWERLCRRRAHVYSY